jgi:hypothetical protein
MAHHIETTVRVNAPAAKVWETLRDFSSIERFSSNVESSPIVGEVDAGLGTKRICTFYDKSTVVEEIVGYEEGESLDIELSEFSMPLESMRAQMKVTPFESLRVCHEAHVAHRVADQFVRLAICCSTLRTWRAPSLTVPSMSASQSATMGAGSPHFTGSSARLPETAPA